MVREHPLGLLEPPRTERGVGSDSWAEGLRGEGTRMTGWPEFAGHVNFLFGKRPGLGEEDGNATQTDPLADLPDRQSWALEVVEEESS